MVRLLYLTITSSLLFAFSLASVFVRPDEREPGVYTFSFGELFFFTLLYVAPLYIVFGVVAYVTATSSKSRRWRFLNTIVGGMCVATLYYVIIQWNSVKDVDGLLQFVMIGIVAAFLFFVVQWVSERWIWKERVVANKRERGGVLLSVFVLSIGVSYGIVVQDSKGRLTEEVYFFPSKEGCYSVVYNEQSAPPLPFEDGRITYDFTKENPIITSSPSDLGWEGKRNSGSYRTHIVVDGTPLPPEEQGDLNGWNGSTEVDGQLIERSFMTFDPHSEMCEELDWSTFQ